MSFYFNFAFVASSCCCSLKCCERTIFGVCMSLIKVTEAIYSVRMLKWSVTVEPGEPENCPSSISLCLRSEESALRWRCVVFVGQNFREHPHIAALQLILQLKWLQCACSAVLAFAAFQGPFNFVLVHRNTEMTIMLCQGLMILPSRVCFWLHAAPLHVI